MPSFNATEGSTGSDDSNDEYWKKIYSICGIKASAFVETVVGRERIRSFWNSGLVVVRRCEGLFRLWQDNFLKTIVSNHLPGGRIAFVEQLSLSPTLAKVSDKK